MNMGHHRSAFCNRCQRFYVCCPFWILMFIWKPKLKRSTPIKSMTFKIINLWTRKILNFPCQFGMVLKGWSNFMLIILLITDWNIFNRFVEVVMKTHFLSSLVTMFLMMMTNISDSIISYFRSSIALLFSRLFRPINEIERFKFA